MKTKSKTVLPVADLTDDEVDAWIRKNKDAINRDLATARKSLRAGQGRKWDFDKFVARAQKRSATKKK